MPAENSGAEKPRFCLRLNFTTALTILVLAIGGMTAAYIGGVMSGRGMAAKVENPPAAVAQPAPAPALPEDVGPILKPQELEFVHELRGDARPAPKAALQPPSVEQAAAVPQGEKAPAQNAATANAPAQEPPNPAPTMQETEQAPQYFDYLFQLAAIRDERAADSLREKLEGRGLRTRLERSGKLLLILVPLRGDADRAAEVPVIARELRLGEPLLRSKKPVGQ